ncbi:MAG: OmpA family protein [Porticoccus sp.]|jgi:peptidoglycan-associated lipoprotein|tara:strand:+ start:1741 stop:2229 length:489 start_codon:yes stop_codon:yes gene_type:complete
MKKIYKYSLATIVLSLSLVGCSMTKTNSIATMTDDRITTGSIKNNSIQGSTLKTDIKVPRVFYFEFDKVMLSSEARSALRLHAQSLRSNPAKIRLLGHADERGSREYNMALGENRGNVVRDFLIQEGVSNSLIEVISYGEEKAASSGSNEDSWAMNRRVELK